MLAMLQVTHHANHTIDGSHTSHIILVAHTIYTSHVSHTSLLTHVMLVRLVICLCYSWMWKEGGGCGGRVDVERG